MAGTKPRRATANGTIVARQCEMRYLTIKASDTHATNVTLKDGGTGGVEVWGAVVQMGTTQHFVFPDAPEFEVNLYVEADYWGQVSLGFT